MSQMPQQAALSKCPSCEEPLESGDRFCGACGYDLSVVPARPADDPTIAVNGAVPPQAPRPAAPWPTVPPHPPAPPAPAANPVVPAPHAAHGNGVPGASAAHRPAPGPHAPEAPAPGVPTAAPAEHPATAGPDSPAGGPRYAASAPHGGVPAAGPGAATPAHPAAPGPHPAGAAPHAATGGNTPADGPPTAAAAHRPAPGPHAVAPSPPTPPDSQPAPASSATAGASPAGAPTHPAAPPAPPAPPGTTAHGDPTAAPAEHDSPAGSPHSPASVPPAAPAGTPAAAAPHAASSGTPPVGNPPADAPAPPAAAGSRPAADGRDASPGTAQGTPTQAAPGVRLDRRAPAGGDDYALQAPDPRVAAEAAAVCVACRAGQVDDDGYCENCGHAQPRERDHMEQECGPLAAVSDRGLRHHRNEDAFGVGTTTLPDGSPVSVAIVCDGVSSATRPDEASLAASRAANASLLEALPRGTHPQQAMHDAILAASEAVNALAGEQQPEAREHAPQQNAPACTIVGAVVTAGLLVVGWVGDSRVYWVPADRSGPAARLTEDDSWAAQMVAAGLMGEAEAYADHRAHAITGWLGADAYELEPHTAAFKPDRPGVAVVCTDGLWNYAESADEMAEVLPADAAARPLHAARVLVGHALDGGGHDNVTVALVPFPAVPQGAGSA